MKYTLLTDGSSDRVLLYIINWLLARRTEHPFESRWADLREANSRPKTLLEKIKETLALYPCDLLFIHRDAEKMPPEDRYTEIRAALVDITPVPLAVCVVPVRMQEAWLLFDEMALRRAAGRPHGTTPLALPALHEVENKPDPKKLLHDLLIKASELTGRHAKKFNPHSQAHRLAELIDDYSPLNALPSFKRLDNDVVNALRDLGL